MRGALAAGVALVLAVAGLGAGYAVGSSTSHTVTATSTLTVTSGSPWRVVLENGTFTGPGCPPATASLLVFMALRVPCLNYTNSSTWYASLLEYNGKDFYASNETVAALNSTASTTYTVWFDNSTAYCVSPYLSVSELPTCPPP